MKSKLCRGRVTIPSDIRNIMNLGQNDDVDIIYDDINNCLIVKSFNLSNESNSRPSKSVKKDTSKKETTKKNVDSKEVKSNNVKESFNIKANFFDADKLYRKCYSECGLIVRTKTKYIDSICEKCKGRLAKEWEDRVDTHCRYNTTKSNKSKTSKQKESNDSTVISFSPFIDHLSQEANGVKFTKHTDMFPTKCPKCGKSIIKKYINIDNNIVCKECAKKDFMKYLKRRNKREE